MRVIESWERSEIAANEGHVGDALLMRAAGSVLEESCRPMRVREIVEKLLGAGFPPCDIRSLAAGVQHVLKSHPEMFSESSGEWMAFG